MHRRTLRSAVALTAVLLPAMARAQAPAGGEFRVNAFTSGSQIYPRLAARPDGGFVAVWMDAGHGGEGWGVFGQRHGATGALLGAEFQANSYTTGLQGYDLSVAGDGSGDFVVIWTSEGQDGNDFGVFGQRFASDGRRAGAEFQVNSYTTGEQGRYGVSVGMTPAGAFVAVWQSFRLEGPTGHAEILGQRFDSGGNRQGPEFRVAESTTSAQVQPSVAVDPSGAFVVVWADTFGPPAVRGQRYDAAGATVGARFQVNTYTTYVGEPAIAKAVDGRFIVAWTSPLQDGDLTGIFAQRFDAAANRLGAEFRVNTVTTSSQSHPAVRVDAAGRFTVCWESYAGGGIAARSFDAAGTAQGPEFRVNTYTTGTSVEPVIAGDGAGNFVIVWGRAGDAFGQRFGGLLPASMTVDTGAAGPSDANGVWEPGETVDLRPAWRNVTGAAQSVSGGASGLTGPPGAAYALIDAAASYGTVADGATGACTDCYAVSVSAPPTRPVTHWDASVQESLLPVSQGQTLRWSLHIGDSFTDVPRGSGFYRFVETLLHRGLTAGCTATTYCPAVAVTREQMAVFVLSAKEGPGYLPPACTTPVFPDVPGDSPFCRFIEELARRGVVSGCGAGNYCPQAAVSREQMAVFVLRTLDPTLAPPACGTPVFNDVPASSPFCRWIEELARRGVVSGCGGGSYCPTAAVTREQMSVFLSATFGLTLYGP